VEVDTLLADAQDGPPDVLARFQRSAPIPGTMLDEPAINEKMVQMQASICYFRLAQQYSKIGLIDQAIGEFDNLLKYVPASTPILREQALLHITQRNYAAAEQRLHRALKIEPSSPDLRFDLAGVLDKLGKTADALKILEENVAAFPQHANSWFLLGVFKARARDTAGAIASLERAVECDPLHDRAQFMLGNLHLQAGDHAAAKRHLLKAFEVTPNEAAIRIGLGKIFLHEQDWPAAEEHLRHATLGDPESAEAQYQLGLAQSAQAKFDDAAKSFGAALRIDANYPGAIKALQDVVQREKPTQ
jgi:tetratricopeptide (TPR) repeat protein